MKKLLYIGLFLFVVKFVFAQVKKEVDDGIYVNFPNTPEYIIQQVLTYISKTKNGIFMVIILTNVIPNYHLYALESYATRKKWITYY